ncbi:MAG: N-acetylmuramoyl-L-alanine amidase [Lachnospiraceae bacterium]|nr:N-acetylmuramoyl-L-alanine amidase [Lachnospiraceae bacterium]
MTALKETFLLLLCTILLLCSISFMSSRLENVASNAVLTAPKNFTVIIDAGHGGFDSGKVGIDGTLEKDVNLSIAKKLSVFLEAADIHVIMTRTTDSGLYEENADSKKRQDMQQRAQIMNETDADCIVSIHQNSYPQEAVDGAQVFYYANVKEGKRLAQLLQKNLVAAVDPQNHRVEKSNDSYYLLKNVSAPIVIAECGFLSNWAESKKLVDDTYQQKLAWAIHIGILQYLNDVGVS